MDGLESREEMILEPNLILQVTMAVAQRMKDYVSEKYACSVCFVPPKADMVLLFVSTSDPKGTMAAMIDDEVASRYIHRVYPIESRAETLEAVAGLDYSGMTLRLQMWPKKREGELGQLIPEEVALDPRSFTHMLFVVHSQNEYHYSLQPRSSFCGSIAQRNTEDNALCRAIYKIKEACTRLPIPLERAWKAIDLGASPGGWTHYLSGYVGKVVAVDPGKVEIPDDTTQCEVVHIKKPAQDALAEIQEHGPYQLICSDMNIHPEAAARMMVSLSHAVEPGGYLVLTIKLVKRGKRNAEEMIKLAKEMLDPLYDTFTVLWLMSNQTGEKTLLARRTAQIAPPSATEQ